MGRGFSRRREALAKNKYKILLTMSTVSRTRLAAKKAYPPSFLRTPP